MLYCQVQHYIYNHRFKGEKGVLYICQIVCKVSVKPVS